MNYLDMLRMNLLLTIIFKSIVLISSSDKKSGNGSLIEPETKSRATGLSNVIHGSEAQIEIKDEIRVTTTINPGSCGNHFLPNHEICSYSK